MSLQVINKFHDTKVNYSGGQTKHLFTRQEEDDSGLYDSNARCYDPDFGRFIQADSGWMG
jgi:RHS repeat-associated protein